MGNRAPGPGVLRTADGRERTYRLVAPDGGEKAPDGGWPLVVMLHGAGATASRALAQTRWGDLAKLEGFVVAFPNGTAANESKRGRFLGNPQSWNCGAGESVVGAGSASARGVDDVGFILALVDEIAAQTVIDPGRIFLAGHSNGAAMAYRIASERPERVAAVGVMGMPRYVQQEELASTFASPVSLIAVYGDQDPFAPLKGGLAGTRRRKVATRPVLGSVADWARANGVEGEPRTCQDDERVTVMQWGPGGGGGGGGSSEVRWVVVKNHGHSWVGGTKRPPAFLVGPSSDGYDATAGMWAFFKAHPKQP